MNLFKERDFTKTVSSHELQSFLFPLFLAAGFQNIYSIVNTAVVSRYLSQNAVAVINSCSGCVSIINATLPAFISGFGIRLARCINSDNSNETRNGFWSAVYLTFAAGILCLFLLPFSYEILRFSNVPYALMQDAVVYFRTVLSGALILYIKLILISVLQAMGNSALPAILSMIGVVTQTVFVLFLINILNAGIASPTLAMLFNNLWQVFLLIFFIFKLSGGRFAVVSPFKIQAKHYLDTFANGCSKGLLFIFLSVGSFFRQQMENTLTTELLAGDAYCDQYTKLFTELLSVYGTAAVVIVGQNTAKGNYTAVKDYVRILFRRSLPLCIAIIIISLAFAPFLTIILAGEGASSEAISAGVFQMRFVVASYPFLTALVLLRYALQSMGSYPAMPLFGLIEMSVVIAMSRLVPLIGYTAVCLGLSLSRIAAGSAAILYYRRFMQGKLSDSRHVRRNIVDG